MKLEDFSIKKYPRTPHLQGSRLQPGDEDLSQIPFSEIAGKHLVIEEKCDGANSALSFSDKGELLLQSRGHYLTGGYRERHFNLMKQWAGVHQKDFYQVLGSRYIMYGEWMYAKHTVFYDALPHYFLEFDVYDRETGRFLDTPSRQKLLKGLPVASVPVLGQGCFSSQKEVLAFLGDSRYITGEHWERLQSLCRKAGLDPERQCRETDPSRTMEGLYLKLEENGCVAARLKYVRASFSQCVDVSESHWLDRPIIPNQLSIPMERIFERDLSGTR